jgi:hypothetical protein
MTEELKPRPASELLPLASGLFVRVSEELTDMDGWLNDLAALAWALRDRLADPVRDEVFGTRAWEEFAKAVCRSERLLVEDSRANTRMLKGVLKVLRQCADESGKGEGVES